MSDNECGRADTLAYRSPQRKMEKFTLTPSHEEIVVNSGSHEGAIDLFSYDAEQEPAARNLGSLFILGWRTDDTDTMGYMVSLIAAMARREYYAQPDANPRDAFTRALRRVNEVVDEFYKSAGTKLSVGIFALPGTTILVSKLGSFKVLLARNGSVIDIMNNVMLFSKEHLEKRRFSSVISGSVQPDDRILAYYPAKIVTARERQIKTWLLAQPETALRTHLERLGVDHPTFAASFVHIDMKSTPVNVVDETPAQPPVSAAMPTIEPVLAWAPRQASAEHPQPLTHASQAAPEPVEEVPNIIPAEFSLGTRRHPSLRFLSNLRFMRMDSRGKAVVLGVSALVIFGGVFIVRNVWFTSPEELRARAVLTAANNDLAQAQKASAADARNLLLKARAAITGETALNDNSDAKKLSASIMAAMDKLDSAQSATLAVLAQPDPLNDKVQLAVFSSTSQSLWAVTKSSDSSFSAVQFRDSTSATRVALPGAADIIVGYKDGILAVNRDARTVTRVTGGSAKSYTIPTQETILDAAQFADNLYVLTNASILKVSDLDTNKPVTKPWLASAEEFVSGGQRIIIDGNVYTMASSGEVVTYYKGKKKTTTPTTLVPSDSWRLIPGGSGELAVADSGHQRVYVFSLSDGALVHTLKVDSDQPLVLMNEGPDGTAIAVTKDNRIWSVK